VTTDAGPDASLTVLRIIARLNVGGPARHVILLDRGLAARGYRTLLIHGAVGPGEASLEELAAAAAIPRLRIPELGRRISIVSDARAFMAVLRAIFRERPDVVHTHTAKAGTLGRVAAALFNATRRRQRRCLIVHTFHGHVLHGYFSPAVSAAVRAAEKLLGRLSDRVVTIAPSQHTELVERFGVIPPDRAVVIPLGLDLEPLFAIGQASADPRAALGIPPESIVVGFVGRMVPIKDLPLLLKAFREAARIEPRLQLVLAGDGPLRPALESTCPNELRDRVRFVGWTSDLPRFYAVVDMVALSSLNEGTPVALIEAMAAAKPVVATRVGGVADVVQDGVTGLLVTSGDAGDLARAMLRLAAAPAERLAMGAAGRRAAHRFSHQRLVEDVDSLYRSGLREKRQSGG
jgi:glycosyltransferase involved in cell wall biosynthesis